jgi:hypothetical protein
MDDLKRGNAALMLAPIRSEGLSSDSPQARGRVPDLRRNRTIRPLPMRGAGAAPRNLRTSRREAGRIFCGAYMPGFPTTASLQTPPL